MTEDQIWLRHRHDELADDIQRCRLLFLDLQDFGKASLVGWNDSCSRDIRARFLDVMMIAAEEGLKLMLLLHENLVGCSAHLIKAYECYNTITRKSTELSDREEDFANISRAIDGLIQQSANEAAHAKKHHHKTTQLIKAADHSGNASISEAAYRP